MKKNRITNKTGLIILLTAVLASCDIIHKYEQPEIKEEVQTDAYRDHKDNDTVSMADISWTQVFSDQKLQALINEGLTNNYDLKVALERIAESQAVFRQSKQASLPSVYVDPSVTYNHQSKAALNMPSYVQINLRTTTVQLPIGASWELDVWGKMRSTKRAALASFLQTGASARAIQTQLIASIASNYYQLLALDQQLEVTLATIGMREKNVEALGAMKEANLVDGAALAQNEANLYAAQVTIPDIKQSIRETENALCVLLGRIPGQIERSTLEEQVVYNQLKTGIPFQLVKNRPDVEAAELAFRSAFETVNVARASFYPALTLTGKTGISALTTNDLLTNSFFMNIVGDLMQPIYNNGINKMNLRKAKAQQQQAFYSFQQTLLTAGQEVSDALYAYEMSAEREQTRQKQIESLQKTVDYTKELLIYSSTTNYTDVITAEQSLLSAQLSGVNDKLLKLLSVVNLYHALGGGWK